MLTVKEAATIVGSLGGRPRIKKKATFVTYGGGFIPSGDNWILITSFWADSGIWIDTDFWID